MQLVELVLGKQYDLEKELAFQIDGLLALLIWRSKGSSPALARTFILSFDFCCTHIFEIFLTLLFTEFVFRFSNDHCGQGVPHHVNRRATHIN